MSKTAQLSNADQARVAVSENIKYTKEEKFLLRDVTRSLKDMGFESVWPDVDILHKSRELGSNSSVEAVVEAIVTCTCCLSPIMCPAKVITAPTRFADSAIAHGLLTPYRALVLMPVTPCPWSFMNPLLRS